MLVSRGRGALVAAALAGLLAGCGGSVADTDTTGAAPTTRPSSSASSPFCGAVAANVAAIRPLAGLSLRGPVNAAGDGLTATVQAARLSGSVLVDAAPAEIRPDVQRTVDAQNVELNALVTAGGDVSAASRDPAVVAQTSSPELAASAQRVTSYVNQNCQPGG